jgi:hypothetical protein
MAGVAGEKFRDDAETVKVRCKPGADDGSFFPAGERGGAGDEPSGEEVSDRAHLSRETAFPLNSCEASLPLINEAKILPLINADQTDFH